MNKIQVPVMIDTNINIIIQQHLAPGAKDIQEISSTVASFFETVGQAIAAAAESGQIKLQLATVTCPKCHEQRTELQIVARETITIFFKITLNDIIHIFYDKSCGENYFRVTFA